MKIITTIWYVSLFLITSQHFSDNYVRASNIKQRNIKIIFNQNSVNISKFGLYAETIKTCPREFADWSLIESFTTKNYSLALCQKEELFYLAGHQKQQHENFISAEVTYQKNNLLIAEDEYGFSFEINNYELKVFQDNQLITQENLY